MADVWSRQFGQVRVSVISEASGRWPMERALEEVPDEVWRREVAVDAEDCLEIGFNLVHLALPGASILLDTGFGTYDPTDPARPLVSVREIRPAAGLEASLGEIGVRPEEITHVLLSHLHGDHILGATRLVAGRREPAFPNARYVALRAEWESAPAWHQIGAAEIRAQMDALQAARAVDLLDGEREIVPRVRVLPAPGESPGHAIVRVDAGDAVVYYLGDLFHYPAEFAHLDWIPRYRDRGALVRARESLVPRFVAEGAWLIPAHHAFPAIGRVVEDAGGYRWVSGA
jgi:glyoxylase-like metal-dependent hydrolase (beta-lactamase superfamily II)